MTEESFMDRLRASSPTSHNESKDYKKFGNTFTVVSIFMVPTLNYGLCYLHPNLDRLANQIYFYLPITREKLLFLMGVDFKSYLSYAASVLGFFISVFLIFTILSTGYFFTVVRSRKFKSVSIYTINFMLYNCFSLGFLLYMTFVFTTSNFFDPRWPGKFVIFFWPVFPAVVEFHALLTGIMLFSNLVGIIKLLTLRWIRHD